MGKRRKGREIAAQAMYQYELRRHAEVDLDSFWDQVEASPESKAFALSRIVGTRRHLERIDELIDGAIENWSIKRLAAVDLAVLRVAVYELLEEPEVPYNIVIDEAIEISRRFSAPESGSFVNGVLDRIANDIGAKTRPVFVPEPDDDEEVPAPLVVPPAEPAMESRMEQKFDPARIEAKWQDYWRTHRTHTPDLRNAENPYYTLMMFPYPSASGLHVGHAFAFPGADIHGRFRRLQGFDVFEPIGFDAFGIHSENYALKVGTNPKVLIPETTANFRRQLDRLGMMVDWEHVVDTTLPDYYRWTQWIFLKLFEHGLAERKKAPVNWCPACHTVLANEQVIDGFCERHPETRVEQRFTEQWFFKITKYCDRLLKNLDWIDWSETTKNAQRNWIGRSEGAHIDFAVADRAGEKIRVFTTRPDTIFGATYMVLAPEHALVPAITGTAQRATVDAYRERVAAMDLVSRKSIREKTGVFTGAWAINPATEERIPIWIADYVLAEYGTGAIMAVPAHDARDFEFAQVFGLPIRRVIAPADVAADAPLAEAYDGPGELVNSGRFSGTDVAEAKRAVTAWLAEKGAGEAHVQFRLHDWCISRQRYWGPPIPIIYCDTCGTVPVPEKDLPVVLPDVEDFRPDDSGVAPLAKVASFYEVPCPKCARPARRETDVSDTFLDSAWYFLRYPSTERDDVALDPEITKKWLPVDMYIGGNEHAVLHLMYTRFVTMALYDLGIVPFEEPFRKFRAHGLIIKDGAKMSKSRGNVVNPDEYLDQYGADVVRMYMMFLGPYEEGGDFRDEGIMGIRRYLDGVWRVVRDLDPAAKASDALRRAQHKAIQKVGDDLENLRYNTAIAALMTLLNDIRKLGPADRDVAETLVLMTAPLAPHIAEELWEALGHEGSIFDARWPDLDPELTLDDVIEMVVQVNGKVRGRIVVPREAPKQDVLDAAHAEETVIAALEGREIRREVVVPGRLVNFVV
jgi:leucyl-tRNA synthetase